MLKELREQGMPVPALDNQPIMFPELRFAYDLYLELRVCRNISANGPANIPYSEFTLYAHDQGFTKAEIREIWEEVTLIDSIDLDVRYKIHEERTKKD